MSKNLLPLWGQRFWKQSLHRSLSLQCYLAFGWKEDRLNVDGRMIHSLQHSIYNKKNVMNFPPKKCLKTMIAE